MKVRDFPVILLLLLGSSASYGQVNVQKQAEDFTTAWLSAYSSRNASALADWLDTSKDVLFIQQDGTRTRGQYDVGFALQQAIDAMDNLTTKLVWKEAKVEGNIARAAVHFKVEVQYGEETFRYGLLQSFTLIRRENTWRIFQLHESVTSPE